MQHIYTIEEEIAFVENNIDALSALAGREGGIWIDPLKRPKSARVKFTEKDYKKDVLEGLARWKKHPEHLRQRFLNGIGAFAQQAMNEEFWMDRIRTIYSMAVNEPPDEEELAAVAARTATRQRLREEQAKMDVFDMRRKCLSCFKYLFLYDERNNKRHEKDEVCTCASSEVIQHEMAEKISDYRKGLKVVQERKKRKEARRAR